ncbi:MAG: amidinotransferase [Candidatus Microsaccharimonas sossegonensis]|uniref:Amidinotransferase n=1 Tax=Candidatus Microsaccharimonas sossegonensis TaxID=2506948 RepID=A0A4Q0AGW9_9BACT|nr:MAG: amidinotransferase [Candidatus Microsaccharimonas sossegonensis]
MTLINHTVLMSDALHFSAEQAINPYYDDQNVDLSKAILEHHFITEALSTAGITIADVPSPIDSQDGVYTANWALVRGDKAVLARLPDVRKAEEEYARQVLEQLGKTVYSVPKGLKFSGQGDALACGNFLFCGQGYRSDEKAQAFAAKKLGYERIQLQTVPELDDDGVPMKNAVSGWADSFFYDIDLALSVIKAPEDDKKGLIAYCHEAFTPESQKILAEFNGVEKIRVSFEEATRAFACNLISTGKTVIMSAHAPKLKTSLETHGLTVLTPEVAELAKGGGYIRCTTLTID